MPAATANGFSIEKDGKNEAFVRTYAVNSMLKLFYKCTYTDVATRSSIIVSVSTFSLEYIPLFIRLVLGVWAWCITLPPIYMKIPTGHP